MSEICLPRQEFVVQLGAVLPFGACLVSGEDAVLGFSPHCQKVVLAEGSDGAVDQMG